LTAKKGIKATKITSDPAQSDRARCATGHSANDDDLCRFVFVFHDLSPHHQ
jgi:hypothetical protein